MARYHTPLSFKTIEEILNKESVFSNLRETVKNYDLVDKFEIIFPELKLIAKAVKIDKQVLYLKVENSVWKSELNFRKNLVVDKVNKYSNEQVIKTIKFL
jgi:Dna[CI] antecedent, DciA